ncbi:cysteine proteinase cathepsin F [Tribonema minus]|uniref:Cysteine proteinase cathepsin F n=1 Tax=Tribonema minus TaxID=303371 RepID=A0A836CJ89_9STRA|nr:cysteine proteinase cathepsin F [Tribonema minus]
MALLIGLAWPQPGTEVSSWMVADYRVVQTLNVMTVFLISGLNLKSADIRAAVSREGSLGFIVGMVLILGVTPLSGFVAVRLPFAEKEFAYGLAIFCGVPTTIAVGVAMTTAAGGNAALALMLTVFSNLLGVLITPFWLQAFFSGQDVAIDALDLLVNLLITVLAPLLVGQAIRFLVPPVRTLVTRHKTALKLISSTSLALIVWQTVSRSAEDILAVSGGSIVAIIAASLIMHVAYLVVSFVTARYLLRLGDAELKAVVIMSSEKTLPVAIAVIAFLTNVGSEGLLSIPPIVSQQVQLFMDSFIATKWGEKTSAAARHAATAAAGAPPSELGEPTSTTSAAVAHMAAAPAATPPAHTAAV